MLDFKPTGLIFVSKLLITSEMICRFDMYNRTRSFVLTACGNVFFWKANRAAKSKSAWMLCMVTVKNWFNEFQRGRGVLMSHAQVPRKRLLQRTT